MTIVRLHGTIGGYVQGIGYRWFVQRLAGASGLSGWVRNVENGDVEFEAQGTAEHIDTFLKELKTGHPEAVVRGINTRAMTPDRNEKGFEIKHGKI